MLHSPQWASGSSVKLTSCWKGEEMMVCIKTLESLVAALGVPWRDCSVAVDSGVTCRRTGRGILGLHGDLFVSQNSSRKALTQVFFLVETLSYENC